MVMGMKSEQEIKDYLKSLKKELARVRKRFAKYDDSDDLESISDFKAMIEAVNWVLNK
jgi:ribosomal protein L29